MCGIFFYVLGYCMWINKKFDLSSRYLIVDIPTYLHMAVAMKWWLKLTQTVKRSPKHLI